MTTYLTRQWVRGFGEDMIVELAQGKHPDMERDLVMLARSGALRDVVGKPPRYSATTIQAHADCARKFFWPTLAGLEQPDGPHFAFGTALHKYNELYLLEGKIPSMSDAPGRLANKGLRHLPPRGTPGMRVERPFEMRFDGVPVLVTGTQDLVLDPPDKTTKAFNLHDYKTARSMRYPKSKAWLYSNIQSNLYAKVRGMQLRAEGYGVTLVHKKWHYYFKQECEAPEPLKLVQSLDEVEVEYEKVIKPNLLSMARMVREMPKVGDVKAADKKICDMYGGCPHRARCFGFGQKETTMGVLAGKFGKQALNAKAEVVRGAGAAINPPKAAPMKAKPAEPEVEEPTEVDDQVDVNDDSPDETPQEVAPVVAAKKPRKAAKTEVAPEPEAEEPTPMKIGPTRTTPGYNSGHEYWLLVNSEITFGGTTEVTPIEKIIGSAQAAAAQSTGGTHYRGGNSYGALEAAFASWMEENAIGGVVSVDKDTIIARDVLSLLKTHASLVIEGRR